SKSDEESLPSTRGSIAHTSEAAAPAPAPAALHLASTTAQSTSTPTGLQSNNETFYL
ncbi:unnamed protein product, partial [Ceratitis capitata]